MERPLTTAEQARRSVCHGDRAALLTEVARCAHNWEVLSGSAFSSDEDWPERMREAEAALIRASACLAQLPDCSE